MRVLACKRALISKSSARRLFRLFYLNAQPPGLKVNKMLECQFCHEAWAEKDLMDREGLSHFLTPNTKRKIVETSGHIWEVVFNATGVETVEQCRKCPIILGAAETC